MEKKSSRNYIKKNKTMDVEKKYKSNAQKIHKNMKKSLLKILFFSIICSHVFIAESLKALIPYYYLPETKSLQKQGLSIGKQAYQLLYFGQNQR